MNEAKYYVWISNKPYKAYCSCTKHWYTTSERMAGNPPVFQRIVHNLPACDRCDCYTWVEVPFDDHKAKLTLRRFVDSAKLITKQEYEDEVCEMQNNRHERSAS